MPQTLQCYKCGTQNALGMRFCIICGEKFLYKCPQCGTNIEPGSGYCSGCSARLDWGGTRTEQTAGISSEPTKLAEVKQKEEKEHKTKKKDQPKQKGLSLWFIAFIVVVLLIIAIFVADTMFLGH
jgi:hypothetical protein